MTLLRTLAIGKSQDGIVHLLRYTLRCLSDVFPGSDGHFGTWFYPNAEKLGGLEVEIQSRR